MHSFKYLCKSTRSLKEKLQQGFMIGLKMARFSVSKNLEDFRFTLERVTIVTKWNVSQKYMRECKAAAACEELPY